MADSGTADLSSSGGEVILDLQKFQIQPMDTLNTEHLQLLILTTNPSANSQSVENISSLPYHDSPLTVTVPSTEDITAVVSEDAAAFIQDKLSIATVSETVLEAGDSLSKVSVSEKQYKCPQCEKTFSGPSSLSRHIKTHSNEKPFRCEPCNKVFSRLSSLKRHQGSHASERPFKCTVCGWTFLQNSDLKIHERTHTGEKPFACDRCEQAFGCKKRLRAHYRKHTGEKPYKCPECEKSFSMRKNVIQHLRIHTGERPFTCEVCKKTYRHQHTLKKHKQLHSVKYSSSLTSETGTTEEAAVWPRKKRKPPVAKSSNNPDVSSRNKVSKKSKNESSGEGTKKSETSVKETVENDGLASCITSSKQNNVSIEESSSQATHSKDEAMEAQRIQEPAVEKLSNDHLLLLSLSSNPGTSDEADVEVGSSACAESADSGEASLKGASVVMVEGFTPIVATSGAGQASSTGTPRSDNGAFKCPHCEKCLSGPSSLSRHIKTHNQEKPFRCVPCNKVFSRLSSLKRHQGAHAQERPFKCTVCGWTFLQNSDLKIHERTHTGEKPFACDRCEQTFGCKKRLRAHYRKHTGEKPYKCPECEKRFSMKKNVIQHLRIHTGERPFTCWVCKKTYRHQHSLKKHIRLHADKNENLDQCIKKIKGKQTKSSDQADEARQMEVEIVVLEGDKAGQRNEQLAENTEHRELEGGEAMEKTTQQGVIESVAQAAGMEKKIENDQRQETEQREVEIGEEGKDKSAEQTELENVGKAAGMEKETVELEEDKPNEEREVGIVETEKTTELQQRKWMGDNMEGDEMRQPERMEDGSQDTERVTSAEATGQMEAPAQTEQLKTAIQN